jgi:S-adenosylmethionine synthetase
VATPLPAAPADDLLFGKNIIAEWNKFVERFKPYGFDKFAKSETEEFALSYVTPGTTSDELVLAMEQARAQNTAQADNDIKMSTIADDGTNMMLFSTAILSQMNEMKAYFESYKNMFDQIVDTCANIQNKQSIQ